MTHVEKTYSRAGGRGAWLGHTIPGAGGDLGGVRDSWSRLWVPPMQLSRMDKVEKAKGTRQKDRWPGWLCGPGIQRSEREAGCRCMVRDAQRHLRMPPHGAGLTLNEEWLSWGACTGQSIGGGAKARWFDA